MYLANLSIFLLVYWLISSQKALAFHKAKKLYSKLFDSDYNKYIRPVLNESHTIEIYLGLQLSQLIDVVIP